MAENKQSNTSNSKADKKSLKKFCIVVGVVFCVTLCICGIVAIIQSQQEGTDRIKQEQQSLHDAVYQSKPVEQQTPLTDEQYQAALDMIFPEDKTESFIISTFISTLQQTLNSAGIDAEVVYFNNFGSPGFYIYSSSPLADVKPYLDFNTYSTYYVVEADKDSRELNKIYKVNATQSEELFVKELFNKTEDVAGITSLNNYLISTDLAEAAFIFNDTIYVSTSGLSQIGLIDTFDYAFQWCVANNVEKRLVLLADDKVVAATSTSLVDKYYRDNYPVNEVAARFRLQYYIAKGFFYYDMLLMSQDYLK